MPLNRLADTGQSIQPPPDVQRTTMSLDALGRFVCNTWDEAVNNTGAPFDAVVIAPIRLHEQAEIAPCVSWFLKRVRS